MTFIKAKRNRINQTGISVLKCMVVIAVVAVFLETMAALAVLHRLQGMDLAGSLLDGIRVIGKAWHGQ